MSIRGFLHFGGHKGLIYTAPEASWYKGKDGTGERKIYDIGEDDCVGVIRTGGGDRQIHSLDWYSQYPSVRKALAANRERNPRTERPKISARPKII